MWRATPVAASGPRLVTVMVKVIVSPNLRCFLSLSMVSLRSAVPAATTGCGVSAGHPTSRVIAASRRSGRQRDIGDLL
jgi:hypothetical protein